MPDHLSVAGRSRVMAAIRSTNTGPERAIRAGLRAVGATGYRIHTRTLPGKPDVAFTRWRVAVFVDGAFWHGHPEHFDPARASEYWRAKIARNQERDARVDATLRESGWDVLRFWDFEVRDELPRVVDTVVGALSARGWPGPRGRATSDAGDGEPHQSPASSSSSPSAPSLSGSVDAGASGRNA